MSPIEEISAMLAAMGLDFEVEEGDGTFVIDRSLGIETTDDPGFDDAPYTAVAYRWIPATREDPGDVDTTVLGSFERLDQAVLCIGKAAIEKRLEDYLELLAEQEIERLEAGAVEYFARTSLDEVDS